MQHLLEKTRHSPRRNLILLALGGVLTLHVAAAGIDIAQFAAGQRGIPLFHASDAAGRYFGPFGAVVGRVCGSFLHVIDREAA